MKPKTVALIAAGALALLILLQNTRVVTLKFLFWEFSASQIIIIPLIFLAGLIVGFFLGRKSWDW